MTYNNTLNALTNYLFFLGAHIGHLRVEAYQSMSNYIIGTRGLFTVIDLQKTVPMLKSAILFMERIVYNFGHALFCYSGIATLNMHLRHYFIRIVTERNQSFSHWRWVSGCVTNYRVVFLRLVKYMFRNASARWSRNKKLLARNILEYSMLHRLHIDYKIRSVPSPLTRKSLLYFLMRYKPIILHKYIELGKKQYSVVYSNAFFKKQYLSMFKYALSTQIMPPLNMANTPATIVGWISEQSDDFLLFIGGIKSVQLNVRFMSVIKGCVFFGCKSESIRIRKKQAKLLHVSRWRWNKRKHKKKHYSRLKQWYRKNISNKIREVNTRNIIVLKKPISILTNSEQIITRRRERTSFIRGYGNIVRSSFVNRFMRQMLKMRSLRWNASKRFFTPPKKGYRKKKQSLNEIRMAIYRHSASLGAAIKKRRALFRVYWPSSIFFKKAHVYNKHTYAKLMRVLSSLTGINKRYSTINSLNGIRVAISKHVASLGTAITVLRYLNSTNSIVLQNKQAHFYQHIHATLIRICSALSKICLRGSKLCVSRYRDSVQKVSRKNKDRHDIRIKLKLKMLRGAPNGRKPCAGLHLARNLSAGNERRAYNKPDPYKLKSAVAYKPAMARSSTGYTYSRQLRQTARSAASSTTDGVYYAANHKAGTVKQPAFSIKTSVAPNNKMRQIAQQAAITTNGVNYAANKKAGTVQQSAFAIKTSGAPNNKMRQIAQQAAITTNGVHYAANQKAGTVKQAAFAIKTIDAPDNEMRRMAQPAAGAIHGSGKNPASVLYKPWEPWGVRRRRKKAEAIERIARLALEKKALIDNAILALQARKVIDSRTEAHIRYLLEKQQREDVPVKATNKPRYWRKPELLLLDRWVIRKERRDSATRRYDKELHAYVPRAVYDRYISAPRALLWAKPKKARQAYFGANRYRFLSFLNFKYKVTRKNNRLKQRFLSRMRRRMKRIPFKQVSVFRTLPSFLSLFIRIFYITKNKFEEFLLDNENADEDIYFNSVYSRFRLFWRAIIFFKCFKKTANVPDCLLFLNPQNSSSQLNDFTGVNLPIVSVSDTVSDLFRITYPIPSNDDSLILLLFYFTIFLNACDTGISNRYLMYY